MKHQSINLLYHASSTRFGLVYEEICFHYELLKLSLVRFESSLILFSQGQETTANLLSFAMMCLWQNKDVLQR